MVYPCSRCDKKSLEYRRILGKKKCSNCTRRGCVCNVYDVTTSEVERISKEGDRLDSEIQKSFKAMREAMARMERFKRLRQVLKERELEMIRRGLDNIEELERIEKEERDTVGSSEVPFDPIAALEQFSSWARSSLPFTMVPGDSFSFPLFITNSISLLLSLLTPGGHIASKDSSLSSL